MKISFEQEKTYLVREHQHEKDIQSREHERDKVWRIFLVYDSLRTRHCVRNFAIYFRNFIRRNIRVNCKRRRRNSAQRPPKTRRQVKGLITWSNFSPD